MIHGESYKPIVAEAAKKAVGEGNIYERIFESTPDGLLVIGEGGVITKANSQAESMFGYRRDELVGQAIEVLIPRRFSAQHMTHRSHYLTEPRARSMGSPNDMIGFGRRCMQVSPRKRVGHAHVFGVVMDFGSGA